ncbi:penicillin-binding protein [Planococcus lenghuensis]|uniref:Penicillin-binding protein n=1 Tax=Planococcus lenghuensis TaxID=2213202 RepID=A0A1Q2L026_9BACL|nr:penicillin-binding protein [Planococcus lenghuensis]AQQ53798.1 penicillin-binding protein [Planococcus lenghuensis]
MNKVFRFQWGAFLLFLFFAGLFFILLTRIVTIQATGEAEGQELAVRAAEKYDHEERLAAERGRILDRNGEVLAEDTLAYRAIAVVSEAATQNPENPQHVINPEETAAVLADHLGSSEDKILKRIEEGIESERYQVEFGAAGRDLSHTEMLAIDEENLPGIIFVRDLKRLYPNGVFASHLIGFAQKEETENGEAVVRGKMGLEAIYDEVLTGQDGKMEFKTDTWGYLLPGNDAEVTPPIDGSDIRLTIDKTIQNFLEDAMTRVEEEYSPKRMMAVVADPKTGEVLAMSQRPSFNPNTLEGLSENWMNEIIQLTIEPGSPMKMFTLAAAIEEDKWDPNAYYQSGSYSLLSNTIRDHNRVGWGQITFLEGFQRSSNVSMAYLLEKIGPETFMEYIDAFGFGEKTGIDLPKEADGVILNDYPMDRLALTFGQGSTVTPVQLIQGASAFANGGVMMKPYVIDRIANPDTGEVSLEHGPERGNQPVTALTAEKVMGILESTVTSEKGTAQRFALEDYRVAGKTGTAQVPDPEGGYQYGHENYLFSFLGFAPADNPQLLVYVAVQQPDLEVTEYGSQPVSEIFKSVTDNSLKYLNVEPEQINEATPVTLDDYSGKPAADIADALQKQRVEPVMIGQPGTVTEQLPASGTSIFAGELVFLKTTGEIAIPDFTGWSKRQLLQYQQLSGLAMTLEGDGFAAEQSVPAGTPVMGNTKIKIKLTQPEAVYKQQAAEGDGTEPSIPAGEDTAAESAAE